MRCDARCDRDDALAGKSGAIVSLLLDHSEDPFDSFRDNPRGLRQQD
jgi:hypothetical protein